MVKFLVVSKKKKEREKQKQIFEKNGKGRGENFLCLQPFLELALTTKKDTNQRITVSTEGNIS